MIRLILFGSVLLSLASLGQAQDYVSDFRKKCTALIAAKESAKDDTRLWQLFDAHWEYQMKASPESATWRGYPGQNGRWSDLSLKAINEGKTTDRLILKAILSVDRAKLTEANQLNYDLFRRNAEMAVEKQRFPGEYLALNQMDGLPRDVPSMIAMMPAENLAGYEDILSRLKGVPALVDQTIALLQEGLARGIVPPKVPLRTVADQVAGQIHDGALTSPMLSHFKFFPSTISSGEQARLTEAAKTVYTGEVKPAMERLHVFLRDE